MRVWNRASAKLNLGLAVTFVALTAGVSVSGYRYYRAQKDILESGVRDQLSSVADLKVQQIVAWRQERIGDAVTIAGNPALAELRDGGNHQAKSGRWSCSKNRGYDEEQRQYRESIESGDFLWLKQQHGLKRHRLDDMVEPD